MVAVLSGHQFEMQCDPIEVTSLHRPDTAWVFTDAHGHEHRWFVGDKPATSYRPSERYETPSLVWVKDGEEYWEDDDEPHPVGHLECRQCGEHIAPRYRPDDCVQYIPGLKHFYVDGRPVTEDEFKALLKEAGYRHD